MSKEALLSLDGISVRFGAGRKSFRAVRGVSFELYAGETLSLVGESGSGKTTIGRAIMRVHPLSAGEIRYRGQRISGAVNARSERLLRQKIQMIFQDPMASLNERAKIDYIVSEGLYNFKLFKNEAERLAKVEKALLEVGLLPEFASRFPHEFSGGQRQRIGIARALVMEPEILIADEPISALDVSIRAQVINLLNQLKRDRGLSYLFIAHDLSVVRFISDRIAVIHRGRIVELAASEELFLRPLHPYTKALLSAVPIPDPEAEQKKKLVIYDPSIHDYGREEPIWAEAAPGHYLLGSPGELAAWSS
ncbi:MAG TPA: peptide ABC transporter ATP-binding protein [Spirochaetaceae bacterium]|nr:peptide ABC transporter ATP-binding protein [Spirochaetaceae bacterium]